MNTQSVNYRKFQDQELIIARLTGFFKMMKTGLPGVLPILINIAISWVSAGCRMDSTENIVSPAAPVDQ